MRSAPWHRPVWISWKGATPAGQWRMVRDDFFVRMVRYGRGGVGAAAGASRAARLGLVGSGLRWSSLVGRFWPEFGSFSVD